jgi:hypothetical protein
MNKVSETLDKLKKLASLNYALIFDKCFVCKKNKNGRFLFCSLACGMKAVRGG